MEGSGVCVGELRSDLDTLERLVPHLASDVVPSGAGPPWIDCTDVPSATRLGALLAPIETGLGDQVVAVSTFVQGYAVRVAGTASALWLLTGRTPSPAAADTAITFERGLAIDLAWRATDDQVAMVDTGESLAVALFEKHIDRVVAACGGRTGVSEELLWGNVSAALAGALIAVHDSLPRDERAQWRRRALQLLDALPHELGGRGSFWSVPAPTERWCWERRSCCLWYRIDPEGGCNSCSLLTPDERRRRLGHAC